MVVRQLQKAARKRGEDAGVSDANDEAQERTDGRDERGEGDGFEWSTGEWARSRASVRAVSGVEGAEGR